MSRKRWTGEKVRNHTSQAGTPSSWMLSLAEHLPLIVMLLIGDAVLWFQLSAGNVVDIGAASVFTIIVAVVVAADIWQVLRNIMGRIGALPAFLGNGLRKTLGVVVVALIVAPFVSRRILGTPLGVDEWLKTGLWVTAFMAIFYIEEFAFIAVHEIGHALAFLVFYHNVTTMRIGPVQFDFRCGRKHMGWATGPSFGGETDSDMTSDRAPRLSGTVIDSAGVIAQLVLAAGAALVVYWMATSSWASNLMASGISVAGIPLTWYEVFQILLLALIAQAIANGGFNLLALERHDGQVLRDALMRSDAFKLLIEQDMLTGMDHRHIRPRDWPVERLDRLTSLFHKGMTRDEAESSYWLIYLSLLDWHEYEAAGEALDEIVIVSLSLDAEDSAEIAYFTARYRKLPYHAQVWMERAVEREKELKDTPGLLKRAEAAIALANGDMEIARSAAQEGIAALEFARNRRGELDGTGIMRMEQLQEMADLAAK